MAKYLEIGCFAKMQKWFIFIVNFFLFLFGLLQIGFACYILAAGTDGLGFASRVLEGNNTAIKVLLAFGIIVIIISVIGCCGAKRENKCMLWIYAFILFFMMMGQSIGVALTGFSVIYGEAIFENLWKQLDQETIDDIQTSYECCSFNGEYADETWPADAEDWTTCSSDNSWDPMITCWNKFDSSIRENYDTIQIIGTIFLGVQGLIYFCTHYVIDSIAEKDGKRKGSHF